MQCLILAGGLATRMRPLTVDTPKALLPVLGRPFVEYQLEFLKSQQVERVVLSIGYLGGMIVEHVGDGSRFGLQVTYVDEGDHLRGTGGAVRLAFDRGHLEDPFLLMQGDSFLPIDVGAVMRTYQESRRTGLMTVYRNSGRWEESNVVYEDGMVREYRKGVREDARFQYVDYGLMVFSTRFIEEYLPATVPLDLALPLNRMSLDGELAGFEATHRFYEIGSPSGLADFSLFVQERGGHVRGIGDSLPLAVGADCP